MNDMKNLASDVVERAKRAGADAVEVYLRRGVETEVSVRNGAIETLQQGQPKSVGIRLWVGERSASTYATDDRPAALDGLIRGTLDLVKLTDPVPELALADAARMTSSVPDLELFDTAVAEVPADRKIALAREAEEAGRAADSRITVSGGASYSDLALEHVLANSHGLCVGYRESFASFGVALIADDEGGKKRNGSWSTYGRFASSLESPQFVGETAAKRAVRQLGAGPVPTQKLPVVFDSLPAASLTGLLFSVLTGGAVERRSSFLADLLGEVVVGDNIFLEDNPLLLRGPGSKPYDGEGAATAPTTFIEAGRLTTFALNSYSARKLGMKPTGHASRPSSGSPGETAFNLSLRPGTVSQEEMIAATPHGFFCEGMMGFGFNASTGDFSRGAFGRMIEQGKLGAPVSEVTISINIRELFSTIDLLGSDIDRRRSVAAPSFRIREATLAGRG